MLSLVLLGMGFGLALVAYRLWVDPPEPMITIGISEYLSLLYGETKKEFMGAACDTTITMKVNEYRKLCEGSKRG